jgi:hypothetical protein
MPSVSKKQHNFMAAIAKNPKFAKKVGIPRSVGEEFLTADKGKKFKEGGEMRKTVKKFGSGSMSAKPGMPSFAKQYVGAALSAAKKAMMGKQVGKAQQTPSNLGNQSAKTAYQLSTQKQLQDAAMKQKPNQKSPLSGKTIGDIRKIGTGLGAFAKTGLPARQSQTSTQTSPKPPSFASQSAGAGLSAISGTLGSTGLGNAIRNTMGKKPGMKSGGMAHSDMKMDKKVVKKAVGMHEKQLHGGKKSDMSKLKSGGMAVKKMARGGGIEIKGKTKGTMVKMKRGGAC